MEMMNCVRMLMELHRVEQSRLARWMDCTPNNIWAMLNAKDIKCGKAVEVLDFMGYEIIVRERGQVRRQDEILIDNGDYIDEKMIVKAREEKRKADNKEAYYSKLEEELRAKYPDGMRVTDLGREFKRNGNLIHQYFDGYFIKRRVSMDIVALKMRELDL